MFEEKVIAPKIVVDDIDDDDIYIIQRCPKCNGIIMEDGVCENKDFKTKFTIKNGIINRKTNQIVLERINQ